MKQRLKGHGLTLVAEPHEERDCSNVWVISSKGDLSSYACATNEGYLDDTYELSPAQLDWLNSQSVQDWLDKVGY